MNQSRDFATCCIGGQRRFRQAKAYTAHTQSIVEAIRDTICRDNPKSAYLMSSFPPNGYQPAIMMTRSHAF